MKIVEQILTSSIILLMSNTSFADCNMEGVIHNQGPIIIENINIFDGSNKNLLKNTRVLIDYVRTPDFTSNTGKVIPGYDVGYFIKEVTTKSAFTVAYDSSRQRVIDGKGMTMMPGLIDAHAHLSWAKAKPIFDFSKEVAAGIATFSDWPTRGEKATLDEAQYRLENGFTSVREVGGIGQLAKPCIDTYVPNSTAYEGQSGSRIWYAGSVISPTGGHADNESDFEDKFRFIKDLGKMTHEERENLVMQADAFGLYKADGVAEVSEATRKQFIKGAQFIKIATGGGISSPHDPIDATIMRGEEVSAITEITDGLHTYTTTHAYEGETIARDINHGVQMIEHANRLNDAAARLAKRYERRYNRSSGQDTSVWLDISPFFDNQYANPKDGQSVAKQRIVQKGTLDAYALVKKYKLKNVGWGADVMFEPRGSEKAAPMIASLEQDLKPLSHYRIGGKGPYHNYGWSNYDILKMVTSKNGQILTKSGPRTPYLGVDGTYLKPGLIGVIKPNAVADLIIVNGNPLENLSLFRDTANNIKFIMKDGIIFKNDIQ